jgi:hypothetical protein
MVKQTQKSFVVGMVRQRLEDDQTSVSHSVSRLPSAKWRGQGHSKGPEKWRNLIVLKNQLAAQFFFFVCLFQFSTCFEQPYAHHQENQWYQYNIWYVPL